MDTILEKKDDMMKSVTSMFDSLTVKDKKEDDKKEDELVKDLEKMNINDKALYLQHHFFLNLDTSHLIRSNKQTYRRNDVVYMFYTLFLVYLQSR